jgi:hypothetical protein
LTALSPPEIVAPATANVEAPGQVERLETAHRKNSVLPVLFFELFELNMRSDSQAIPTRSLNNSPCKRKDTIRANTVD